MSKPSLEEMFNAADDEYLKFGRIPEAERRHVRPDLCAFLYLHEKLGGRKGGLGEYRDMVGAAEHDQIFLDYDEEDCGPLTQEDIVYLRRCGVCYDREADSLAMFV